MISLYVQRKEQYDPASAFLSYTPTLENFPCSKLCIFFFSQAMDVSLILFLEDLC